MTERSMLSNYDTALKAEAKKVKCNFYRYDTDQASLLAIFVKRSVHWSGNRERL